MKPIAPPPADKLREMSKNLSLRKMGRHFNVSKPTVRRWLDEAGIQKVPGSELCPRKGNPKARDPELRTDCQNMVIHPKTGGSDKGFCSRKCTAAAYRGKKAEHLAQLKKDWWRNLPEAAKAKVKKRTTDWHKNNRQESNAKKVAWFNALSEEGKEKLRARNRKWHAKQKALVASAWRPPDWMDRPLDWRIIGNELLSWPGQISNEDLGEHLDGARLLKCPYADNWETALCSAKNRNSKRAINLVSEIRKWVRKPGKVRGAKVAA